jgi:hypothetical protein
MLPRRKEFVNLNRDALELSRLVQSHLRHMSNAVSFVRTSLPIERHLLEQLNECQDSLTRSGQRSWQ